MNELTIRPWKIILLIFTSLWMFVAGIVHYLVETRFPGATLHQLLLIALPAFLLYRWAVLDAKERNFVIGSILTLTILFVGIIGFPYFFVSSRGWKGGFRAILLGLFFSAGIGVLNLIGYIMTAVIYDGRPIEFQ